MPPLALATLSRPERRRAMRLGYVHGVLWAIGNGLTTGVLVSYFVQDLGARGRALGLVLALPALVGCLRLAAPVLIRWLGGFKRTALALYVPSYLLIAGVPILAFPDIVSPLWAVHAFVALICAHHLLEYTGTVALWSWLAEIVPLRLRGRYFAGRQRWQLAALIPTLLAAAWFASYWRKADLAGTTSGQLIGYALPISAGALVLGVSLVPLALMPNVYSPSSAKVFSLAGLFAPLADRSFQRLLMFGCWFSFFNGLTQSAQNIFPRAVLDITVLGMAGLHVLTQLGQIGLTPWVGRFSDRFGNRPTLILCQLVVASASLFYLAATPAHPWWIVGAWIAFSAYVGLNVCLPNLMLKLAPGHDRSAYVATYFAITGLAYGISTIAGGILLDSLETFMEFERFAIGPFALTRYEYLFYVGWVTRTLAVLLLFAVVEPGAWTWRQILRGKVSAEQDPAEVGEWG